MAWNPTKSIDPIERERFESWWASDFTWSGLSEKPWPGWVVDADVLLIAAEAPLPNQRSATLQDYWRRGPGSGREGSPLPDTDIDGEMRKSGELVDDDAGHAWHICHCPLFDRHGDETVKSGWVKKSDWSIVRRLIYTRIEYGRATITDDRGETAKENRAILDGIVTDTIDVPSIDLHMVASDAVFLGNVYLEKCVFISACAFSRTSFRGNITFHHTIFGGRAWFDSAYMRQQADFKNTKFFEPAQFLDAMFCGETSFREAIFQENAGFVQAIFNRFCQFDDAHFGLTPKGLGGEVYFNGAQFCERVSFFETRFHRKSFFQATSFRRHTIFNSTFEQELSCLGASFSGPLVFCARFDNPEIYAKKAFSGARFESIANFTGSGCRILAAFDHAIFEKQMIFDNPEALLRNMEKTAEREFLNLIIPGIENAAKQSFPYPKSTGTEIILNPYRYFRNFWRSFFLRREALNDSLAAIEGGCRTLKGVMSRHQDEVREQRFHRFMLRARRLRTDTRRSERYLSQIYRFTSNYGASTVRPLFWLAMFALLFTYAYGMCFSENWQDFLDIATFKNPTLLRQCIQTSLSHTLPFGGFVTSETRPEASNMLGEYAQIYLGIFRTAQVNISTILIFLFGLSTKKMFQIK